MYEIGGTSTAAVLRLVRRRATSPGATEKQPVQKLNLKDTENELSLTKRCRYAVFWSVKEAPMAEGTLIAYTVAVISTVDPVMGEVDR